MSQKRHLLCFVFFKDKGCSMHLFVQKMNEKFVKIQENSKALPPKPQSGLCLTAAPRLTAVFCVHFISRLATLLTWE